MKSMEPLISSGFKSYEEGFIEPMVPQSRTYNRTDGGGAGRV
jgi:hypothetical protein